MIRTIPESREYICDRCDYTTTDASGWRWINLHSHGESGRIRTDFCPSCYEDYIILVSGFMKTNPQKEKT